MKITHSSGESFDLFPDTTLEMQRTNPFFNEYGEQSLPVTLPASIRNCRLLGHPEELSVAGKVSNRTNVRINAGAYQVPARQAVLGVDGEGIKASYYLNEGGFYDKIADLDLSSIFADEVLSFASVDAAIAFCRSLQAGTDARFRIFPVAVTAEDTFMLNQMYNYRASDGFVHYKHETSQSVTFSGTTMTVPPGYFITPFFRINYVLERILSHLGYTMVLPELFTAAPFADMVLLNNTADAIVTATIKFVQLLPDVSASTILDIYRYRFCGEFVADEINKKITFRHFTEVVDMQAFNISSRLIGKMSISYPEKFRQIKLAAESVPTGSSNDGLTAALSKYDNLLTDKYTGEIYREGYDGLTQVKETVGNLASGYYAGGILTAEEKTTPETLITMLSRHESLDPVVNASGYTGAIKTLLVAVMPEIPEVRTLNSHLSSDQSAEEAEELKPMLCFAYHNASNYCVGTLSNYMPTGGKIWDYTLFYNGADGLFERFWRGYDDMLRNSLLTVSAELNLSESDKLTLSPVNPVLINGQKLLPDTINYVPGVTGTKDCSFRTCRLYTPLATAVAESSRYNTNPPYKWQLHSSDDWDGNYGLVPDTSIHFYLDHVADPPITYDTASAPFFPPLPTQTQFLSGGRYHSRTYAIKLCFYVTANIPGVGPITPIYKTYPATLTTWYEVVES